MTTATLEHTNWTVARGQHVQVSKRGVRRRTVDAIVVSGSLAQQDATAPEFELVIALPGASDRPITISSGTARSIHLASEGVFQQRGRPRSMWLRVSADLDLCDVRQLTGHGRVTVVADLNLNPTVDPDKFDSYSPHFVAS